MASERGYDVRTAPSAGPGPVLSDPRDFGAQVGAALEQFGQAKHSADVRAYQIERQQNAASEQASFASNFAKYRQSMDGVVLQTRGNAAPGAAGHPDSIKTVYEAGRDALLSGITEDRLRQQASAQFDEYGASLLSRESVWAEGKRVAKLVTDTGDLIDTGANRIRTARDQAAYADELRHGQDAIAAMQGIDDDTKAKLQRQMQQSYSVSFVQGLFDSGQAATAKGLIESGAFNDVLEPKQIEALMNGADVEIRRIDAEGRTRAAAMKQYISQTADLAIKAVKDGVLYEDGDLAALEERAGAAGLAPAKLYEIQDVRALNTVKREFQNASPSVIADNLREADAAVAKAGAGADPKLVQRRNHLETVLGQRRAEIGNDQLGFAARNGIETMPIDWSAPAPDAVAARAKAVEISAGAAGMPPQYFTTDEVGQLRGRIESGKGGALAALDAARAFGGAKAVAAAKQLAPNDPGFAYLATLDREVAGMALSGRWHLKTDKRAVTLEKDSDTFDDYKAEFDQQDARVNKAIQSLGAQQANTIWNTARDILAGYIAQGLGPLRPDLRWRAINEAIGATGPTGAGRKGGLAQWGDAYFMRPSTMTSDEFARRVQWTMTNGKGGGAVNADGSPARLSAAVPVFTGANTYRFDAKDGKPLRKKDGSLFTVWTGQ
jgi:hypothetical protein